MTRAVDFLSAFHFWTPWTIEDKERQERSMHQGSTTKKQGAQDGVFPFFAIFCMEKPYTSINANAKAADSIWIYTVSFGNSNLC